VNRALHRRFFVPRPTVRLDLSALGGRPMVRAQAPPPFLHQNTARVSTQDYHLLLTTHIVRDSDAAIHFDPRRHSLWSILSFNWVKFCSVPYSLSDAFCPVYSRNAHTILTTLIPMGPHFRPPYPLPAISLSLPAVGFFRDLREH
jgi:hypothetical protein